MSKAATLPLVEIDQGEVGVAVIDQDRMSYWHSIIKPGVTADVMTVDVLALLLTPGVWWKR